MLKKNAIKVAKFLGSHSTVFDHANDKQKEALMKPIHLDHLMILDAFFEARESLLNSMSASNSNNSSESAKG